MKKIFYTAKKIIKSNVIPKWETMKNREWDQLYWLADMTKSKKLINYKVKFSLNAGIKKTIDWFKKNQHLYQDYKK